MFNGKKLRAAMVMADKSVTEVCEALEIVPSTFYRKMENDGDFSRKEIAELCKLLDIKEPQEIFFSDLLA